MPHCELATLYFGCQDITPVSFTRIDFAATGNAIGYLLERAILPPSCRAYFPYEYVAGETAPYTLQAILPTGLAAPQTFEGTAQNLDTVTTSYDQWRSGTGPAATAARMPREPERVESCALRIPVQGGSGSGLVWFAAAGAVVASRRWRR